jgi:hypothetical protein
MYQIIPELYPITSVLGHITYKWEAYNGNLLFFFLNFRMYPGKFTMRIYVLNLQLLWNRERRGFVILVGTDSLQPIINFS